MSAASQNILTVENLSVVIPAAAGMVRAVDRVSLTVERGKTLALVGESGSGKSMLCKAIMGLQPRSAVLPGEMRILFDGRDLGRLPVPEMTRIRGREIGIVLQNPLSSLNPVLTVGRQIMEPMLFHLRLPKARARERAIDLLRSVGIPRPEEAFTRHPHQLSGGMRQRVAIAIALSCDPKLLIADEPTTALDVTVQAEILNLLGRLQRERDMALLLVTHDLGVVAGRSDRTAVMYAGRIVEEAPTLQLFERTRMQYTKGLLDSIPRLDHPPGRKLAGIAGSPPELSVASSGCRFAPRCAPAQQLCLMEDPPLLADQGDGGHSYACWFPIPVPALTPEPAEGDAVSRFQSSSFGTSPVCEAPASPVSNAPCMVHGSVKVEAVEWTNNKEAS